MESDVFTEEVHEFRSFMEIFESFLVLVVVFLYFVPDYFGIQYVNIGLNWNVVFLVFSISVPFIVAIFGFKLFTLSKNFNKNHSHITNILSAVNLFAFIIITLAMCLLFIGIVHFLLELIYIFISSLLAFLSY